MNKINKKSINPAILSTDINDFESKVNLISKFSKNLHVDICDGNFAQTKTIEVNQIKTKTLSKFDFVEFHLMVQNPVEVIDALRKLNPSRVYIHIEIKDDQKEFEDTFYRMKTLGIDVSIAINPYTNYEHLMPLRDDLNFDLILFMGVTPGFQGQKIVPEVIDKISLFNQNVGKDIEYGLDGGVNVDSIKEFDLSLINHYVIGSGILKDKNPSNAYRYYNSILVD